MGLWVSGVVKGSVFLAADSIISNFLAMARADLGSTGGGEPDEEAAGDERGGDGVTRVEVV